MARAEYDSKGLPVVGTRNPSGNLTVRLDKQGWVVLGQLRELWSAERGVNLSITDVVRAALFHARDLVLSFEVNATPEVKEATVEVCLACNVVPEGNAYSCLACGRRLAETQVSDLLCIQGHAVATEEKKEEVRKVVIKPAEVRKSRKKKG